MPEKDVLIAPTITLTASTRASAIKPETQSPTPELARSYALGERARR